MSATHIRSESASERLAAPCAGHNLEERSAAIKPGLNPLYGSEIMGSEAPSNHDTEHSSASTPQKDAEARRERASSASKSNAVQPNAHECASGVRRTASSQRIKRADARGRSPARSNLTASTSQSSTSSRRARPSTSVSKGSLQKGVGQGSRPSTRRNRDGKTTANGLTGQQALVPAQLAPVPPPPPKRKASKGRSVQGDVETGGATSDAAVLEDAPDKTLMEMLQTYLKKQNVYTRVTLVAVLLILAGGAMGAYGVMLYYAIAGQDIKYIALSIVLSLVLGWVLWKYCFSDQKLQDQSAIAQDIATLYAAIPDHTASRGVSDKGRAQFTAFKYEKAEMMFTAVTDDGVSLGSERGSELMMDGADPSCPLCNIAYVEGTDLCLLPCLHVFHKSCIHKWCNKNVVCPLCKRHLEAAEPIHTLSAYSGGGVQSEPGGHAGATGQPRAAWRHMLGTGAPGPASGHGSARGLGGTRSDDGLWNDRVLNAAQRQIGGGHNRVTSFSSETRRANSARGRTGGPPQSSSAGAALMRTQSANATQGRGHQQQQQQQQQQQRTQRTRSSSFTTANERCRGGSGRVAHGTAPNRGGSGSARGGEATSPRATSDLGLGAHESEGVRVSDAMLSRHAMRSSRSNSGVAAGKALSKQSFFGDENTGSLTDGTGTIRRKGGTQRKPSVVTVSAGKSSKKGVRSRASGPAVMTAQKVDAQQSSGPRTTSTVTATGGKHRRGSSARAAARDAARSGEESESDAGGERVFSVMGGTYRYPCDDDSADDEVTTKALTYGPRKPRNGKDHGTKDNPGHRRQSSAGSTSAEENVSGRKPRRRRMSHSKSGSGSLSAMATAAATAEAVSKLLSRPQHDDRSASTSSRPGNAKRRSASASSAIGVLGTVAAVTAPPTTSTVSAVEHDQSSGAESGSDARNGAARRRGGSRGGSRQGRRQSHPASQPKTTPIKNPPVTKGTPAPPMAAARVATWNSNASISAPMIDSSFSTSGDIADMESMETDGAVTPATPVARALGAVGGPTPDVASTSPQTRKSSLRAWSLRVPSSAGSAEFFGFGSNTAGSERAGSGNAGSITSTEGDHHGSGSGSAAAAGGRKDAGHGSQGNSLASKVFGRKSAARLFSSGSAARIGTAPASAGCVTDSEDEQKAELSERAGRGRRTARAKSPSVQELIKTYEKSRSSSDEKAPPEDPTVQGVSVAAASVASSGKRRTGRTFSRRRNSGGGAGGGSMSNMNDLAATESEQDDDLIDRPKLSYKRKSSHNRSKTPPSDFQLVDPIHLSALAMDSAERGVPMRNPDGEDWGEESPYARPKLSYASNSHSSGRKGSLTSESGLGAPGQR